MEAATEKALGVLRIDDSRAKITRGWYKKPEHQTLLFPYPISVVERPAHLPLGS